MPLQALLLGFGLFVAVVVTCMIIRVLGPNRRLICATSLRAVSYTIV